MSRHRSVQDVHMDLEEMRDDALWLSGARLRAVVEVAPINYGYKEDEQQLAIAQAYARFLDALSYPIQVVVRFVESDLGPYIAQREEQAARAENARLRRVITDNIVYARGLVRTHTLTDRRFYVVVGAEDGLEEYDQAARRGGLLARLLGRSGDAAPSREAALGRLDRRTGEIVAGLDRCGLSARRLSGRELIQLHYEYWCPGRARSQPLPPRLAAALAPVVAAGIAAPGAAGAGFGPSDGEEAMVIRRARRAGGGEPPPRERRYGDGGRCAADLVAPASLEVRRDHLRAEGGYARSLVVTGYPRPVETNWLGQLLALTGSYELSWFIERFDPAWAVGMLGRQANKLGSAEAADADGEREPSEEQGAGLEDVRRVKSAVSRGESQLFSVGFYATARASSLGGLDAATRRLEHTLARLGLRSLVAEEEQDSGFRSTLPEGVDRLRTVRNLDTMSIASQFPFSSPELRMPTGVMYGFAPEARSLVIVDPFDPSLRNANMAVVGASGAGKSMFLKLLSMRVLPAGVDFLVIDPHGEYRAVCAALGGEYVDLSPSSARSINPLDPPPPVAAAGIEEDEHGDPLAAHLERLNGWLEMLLSSRSGEALDDEQAAAVDRALRTAYDRAGVGPSAYGAARSGARALPPPPLLEDVAAALREQEGGAALAARLAYYAEGPRAALFNRRTNIALDSRLIAFGLSDTPKHLWPHAVQMISAFVWNQVRSSLKRRALLIDEAWQLMRYPQGGAFVEEMARGARKRWLSLIVVSQDAEDFLGSPSGRAVVHNAELKLLLGQDSTTIGPVVETLHLSDREREYLLRCGKGQGLFFVRATRVPIEIGLSPEELEVCTSAPAELAARAERERLGRTQGGGESGADGDGHRALPLVRAEGGE